MKNPNNIYKVVSRKICFNPIKSFAKKVTFLTILTALLLQLGTALIPAQAVAPQSLSIDGTECVMRLVELPNIEASDNASSFSYIPNANKSGAYSDTGDNTFGGFNPTQFRLPLAWYLGPLVAKVDGYDSYENSASIKNDVASLQSIADPDANNDFFDSTANFRSAGLDDFERKSAYAIVFDALVAGNGDPNRACRNTPNVFFSRPSNPSRFFGSYKNNNLLLTGTLNPSNSTFTFDTATDSNSPDSNNIYNVAGDLSNPIFRSGTTATGFCSNLINLDGGEAYRYCMRANVLDFNTITYRGERYVLDSWKGNQSIRMEYVLDLATSPYETRKTGLANCSDKPRFRIDGDNADSIEELTTDGDNGISGFFGQLADLAGIDSGTGQTIQFVDYGPLCSDAGGEQNIELYNVQNFLRIAHYFALDNAVAIIPNNPGDGERAMSQIYDRSPSDPTRFVPKAGVSVGSCTLSEANSSIKFENDPSTSTANGTYSQAYWTFPNPDSNCAVLGANIQVKISTANSGERITSVNAGSGGPAGTQAPAKTCTREAGALGWILCPILTVLDEGTQSIENQIRGFLFVDTERFTQDSGAFRAWSTFRGIATVIIVIVALIMIFSQAMGDGIFDNYSVKKLLPRLVLAGITIQVSWFLITELVNIFNLLGNGIGGLLLSSFDLETTTNLRDQIGNITQTASGGDFAAGAIFTGLAIAAPALLGGIVAIAIGVGVAILIGLVTLILRDMIILLGVVLAPVAIAMSVLPGTQKTAKWWWESLEKALLMYPLVMALLASGKIVATLLFDSATPEGDAGIRVTYLIAGIIAWYAPFFFLPKALQAGGTALNKLTGAFNDRSKGFFDKIKGFQDNRSKIKSAARQRNAFDKNHKSWYARGAGRYLGGGVLEKGLKAKSKGAAYLAAGAIGRGSRFEREGFEVNAAKESAQRRLFNKEQALTEVKSQEAKAATQRADVDLQRMAAKKIPITFTDSRGVTRTEEFSYGNKEHLEWLASSSTDKAQTQAALNRINTLGADDVMRRLRDGGMKNRTFSDGSDAAGLFSEHLVSPETYGAFKDKASDIAKGGTGIAFGDGMTTENVMQSSKNTIAEVAKHYQEAQAAIVKHATGATLNRDEQALYDKYSVIDPATGKTALEKAVARTAASVRESATNANLKGNFKQDQAIASRQALEILHASGLGVAMGADYGIAMSHIDAVSGVK